MPHAARTLLLSLLISLCGAFALAGEADAQCSGPGGTCGLFGGSCCSGSSCVIGVCVANCAGDGGLCVSSGGCCGNRVCALGFCQTPRTLGEACGPGFPCASGLNCDPLSGFVCIDNASLGEACGPLVQCNPGLVCDPLAGFRCVDQTAQLGEACGPLVHCAGGLVCDPLAGFRCVDQTAGLGQACGPLVQCESGLVCDPFAGFVCVDQSVGAGQACGPLVQCNAGLVCDPLAGFRCVPATTPALGEACGPLFPCDEGLVCDPLAGFRCVDQRVGEGDACGPLVQCEEGLFCDPLAGFRCVAAAGVDQPCGPLVGCEAGLRCSLALRCSHEPGRAGETCDATAPCGEGLFCQPGLPQRCQALKKPGEGCSIVNPCVAGASCEPCFVDGCSAPLQCFPNSSEGAISEHACRALYSPGLHQAANDIATTMTFAVGNSAAAVAGEAQSFGVAYGQDGRFGCYTSLCGGVNVDFSIEHFVAVGFATSLDAVGGKSFASFQEAEIPGDLLNFSTAQIFSREDVLPIELTGTESAFSVGISPEFALPFSAGAFLCETVLDTVITPATPDVPPPPAVAPAVLHNPGFALGTGGWDCVGEGTCSRSEDDAAGSEGSGSGEVVSPPAGVDPGIAYLASSCVAVVPDQTYEVSAWVKTVGARAGALSAWWNAGLDCDGALARSDTLGTSPPDGVWRRVTSRLDAPGGAQSVRLLVSAERDANSGAPSTSRVDAIMIPEPGARAGGGAALLSLGALAARRARRGSPRQPRGGAVLELSGTGQSARASPRPGLFHAAWTLGKRRITKSRCASQSANHADPTASSPSEKRIRLGSSNSRV
jgi:hypothetical protein